jgi:DNA-binding NarL/FixJ family response regulator
VLIVMLEELPNKLIARRLGLSENTVMEHVSAILQRLGLRTRMEVMSKMKHFCVRSHLT